MIRYHYQIDFELGEEDKYTDWILNVASRAGRSITSLDYIFCDDEALLEMNRTYLQHDYYTDILTFDYGSQMELKGDLFLSVDRIRDNAAQLGISFEEEVRRVMIHGVLHLMGYSDHNETEKADMRAREEECLQLFHVKH
jgi:rRNA maturation RNase YbeY